MVGDVDWERFRFRLGKAIDQWPGGGQGAFSKALAKYARKRRVKIPTSYRTLVNYLADETRPSLAWIELAAEVLGVNPEWLETGNGPEVLGQQTESPIQSEAGARAQALMYLVLNDFPRLPREAVHIVGGFAGRFFQHDTSGWIGWLDPLSPKPGNYDDMIREHFAPLRAPSSRGPLETIALAASLAAAAYIQLATVWKPAHVRGRASQGVVKKDYKVKLDEASA